jgi:hypothetical protein
LRKLKIENNNINDISKLNNLLGLNIKKINLKGNTFIKENPDYPKILFDKFLSLISIDGYDREGNDVESTEYENSQNLFEEMNKFIVQKENSHDNNDNHNDVYSNSDEENIIESLECEMEENEEEEEEEDDDDDSIDENKEDKDKDNDNISKEKE